MTRPAGVTGAAGPTPGHALLELVAVMDRLRSPGGCPWDARQTHASLLPYLLEEAHEVVEAVETGDAVHLREELGDLLLQVVFHARVAQDATEPADRFDVDDVAAGIVAKLVRRHPHVFADPGDGTAAPTVEEVETGWEELKRREKPERASALDGVPSSLPALARAAKLLGRLERAGLDVPLPDTDDAGARLLRVAAEVAAAGADPEGALRGAVRDLEARARAAESGQEVPDRQEHDAAPGAVGRGLPGSR